MNCVVCLAMRGVYERKLHNLCKSVWYWMYHISPLFLATCALYNYTCTRY